METIVAIFQIDFQNSWWNLIEGFIDMGNSIPWIDVWCNTGSHEQNFQNFHRCFVVRFITFRFVYYLVEMAFSAWHFRLGLARRNQSEHESELIRRKARIWFWFWFIFAIGVVPCMLPICMQNLRCSVFHCVHHFAFLHKSNTFDVN